jgi:hypothetical protein
MLLTLLATSGAVILAAALQRRKLTTRDRRDAVQVQGTGDEAPEAKEVFSELRRGDRPDPPAPPVEPPPDNLEPFRKPGSIDERR